MRHRTSFSITDFAILLIFIGHCIQKKFLSFSRTFCDYQGDFFKIQRQFKDKLHYFRIPGVFSRTKVILKDFSRSVPTLGNRDNLGIISHIFSLKNIFCDPSLERSHRDGSDEGSQHMFSTQNKKNYL